MSAIKYDYASHYILVDEDDNILDGISSSLVASIPDGYILLTNEGGRYFELLGEVNPTVRNMAGQTFYKYIDNQVVKV